MEAEGTAATGRGDGEKGLALSSWKGEVRGGVDGLGVVNGVEADARASEEIWAFGGLGTEVDHESFEGALGFRISMYRADGGFGGGDGLRGGVWLGLLESSTSL